MNPRQYLEDRLSREMHRGNMHHCLRDVGRLAGGYQAAGDLTPGAVQQLGERAAALAIHPEEARTKWAEAVAYGLADPVRWQPHVGATPKRDHALSWDDRISDDYVVADPDWVVTVEQPAEEEWNPIDQVRRYLTTLFDATDVVGYCTEPTREGKPTAGVYTRTAGELLAELDHYGKLPEVIGDTRPDVGAWVRFNPLSGTGAKDADVTDYRFALVESDSIPIDQQRGIYDQLELPIAALVHSGNKSLHAIVRVEAPDKSEYSRRVDMLYRVCEKNGLVVDRQNKNPSRYSRLPGIVRGDKKQFLVATNVGKKSWSEWESWIESVNDDLPAIESLAEEWDHLPPLADPLIDGVLRCGHKMLLSGSSKGGKSFLLIQLCAAVAEGKTWIGWPCRRGRVLYVNLELDRASCLHRFAAVYRALGWEPRNLDSLDIWNLRGHSIPMDKLAPKLIRRAESKHYALVVIDPIYKVITGDENAAHQMAAFCNQFDRVCHDLSAAVVYCHHHSKGLQGGKRSMDRASGSGVFARDPDALLDMIELEVPQEARAEVGPGVSGWRVSGTFREFAPSEPINVWFQHPTHRRDVAGLLDEAEPEAEAHWRAVGRDRWESGGQHRKVDRQSKLHEAMAVLAQPDGTVTISAVAEYLDRTNRTIRMWASDYGVKYDNGVLYPALGSEGSINHVRSDDEF